MLVTYNGKHEAVSVTVAGRPVTAMRGESLDVPAEIAKALSKLDGWHKPAAPATETEEV
jgi:hypothetical protein